MIKHILSFPAPQSVPQRVSLALTLAAIRTPYALPRTLKPKGIQPSECSILGLIPENKGGFCPAAVPPLSRTLSRWFVFVISGLGGLSRCPAPLSHICVRVCAHKDAPGQAGQRDNSSSLSILSNKFNYLESKRTVPQAVPLLSRSAFLPVMSLKFNKIMGLYCHD